MTRVVLTAVAMLAACVGIWVAGAAAAPPGPPGPPPPPPPPPGGPTVCNSSTSLSGPINGDVNAQLGCDLSNVTTISGNVRVNQGGSLTIQAPSNVTIAKDLTSSKAAFINVAGQATGPSTVQGVIVKGAVHLDGTTGDTAFEFVMVNGDLEVKNSTAFLQVDGNIGGHNLMVHDNKGNDFDGLVDVAENTVSGDIQVQNNQPNSTDFNDVNVSGNNAGHDLNFAGNQVTGHGATNVSFADDNQVSHDLNVNGNNTDSGTLDVSNNNVSHNLNCGGNKPKPTNGNGNNTAQTKGGDCKSL
jgi:hypothetical protein